MAASPMTRIIWALAYCLLYFLGCSPWRVSTQSGGHSLLRHLSYPVLDSCQQDDPRWGTWLTLHMWQQFLWVQYGLAIWWYCDRWCKGAVGMQKEGKVTHSLGWGWNESLWKIQPCGARRAWKWALRNCSRKIKQTRLPRDQQKCLPIRSTDKEQWHCLFGTHGQSSCLYEERTYSWMQGDPKGTWNPSK